MGKLYACIAGEADRSILLSVAQKFAYHIELRDGAVLFDVTGLQNHSNSSSQIAEAIVSELRNCGVSGNVAVSDNAGSAVFRARNTPGVTVSSEAVKKSIPLDALDLDSDMLATFRKLGINTTLDLKSVPADELIARYGLEFGKVIDLINERSRDVLTPNLTEEKIGWRSDLDFPIADAEQLIFILGHGLSKVFNQASRLGFSTERIDVAFGLDGNTQKHYELKLSFPSLDKSFWLKLINLRVAADPPDAAIVSLALVCHFTRPRTVQHGLYSSTRPEPESLLLTVGKIKKMVGEENVGVPVLLNQRLPRAFTLDARMLPAGKESRQTVKPKPILALNYFNPPLRAETTIRNGALVFLSTLCFKGKVVRHGGVWKESSQWWNRSFWQTSYWDVELENRYIYRLSKQGDEWFVIGEYD